MGRRPREEQEGGIYHVIQRGNNRAFVFEEDTDKEYLIDQLWLISKNGCKIYRVFPYRVPKLISYCQVSHPLVIKYLVPGT